MSSNQIAFGWGDARPPASHAYLAPKVTALLRDAGVKTVLDIGSGNGALANLLAEQGFVVTGIEPDPEGFALACNGPAAFYNVGIYDSLDCLDDQTFDAVISLEVLEHLYSPSALLRVASQRLKCGGILVVSTPYHGYLKNLAISIAGAWDRHFTSLVDGAHIKFWSRSSLTALLQSQGFKFSSFHGVGRLPYLWRSMIIVANPM